MAVASTRPSSIDDIDEDSAQALAAHRRAGVPQPIFDTHLHFYQVSRPGGVPWPPASATTLYRDVLPPEYKALAARHGIVRAGVVEASPLVGDNGWVLDQVTGDDLFAFLVGSLEIGAPDFAARLDELAQDPRVVGLRGYLWSPPAITLDAAQREALDELARRGMTLDLISRGHTNPKPDVEALCAAAPRLRVIVDHLAGARGTTPDPDWTTAMHRCARRCPNLSIKFSSFCDMHQVGDGDSAWHAPPDLASYRPHFDALMDAFGPERLIFGSNWPVCELGGGIGQQIDLAEQYLAGFGLDVRDKVMFRNAMRFYRRLPAR